MRTKFNGQKDAWFPLHFSTPPPENSGTTLLIVRVCWLVFQVHIYLTLAPVRADVCAEATHQTVLLLGDASVPRCPSCPSPSVLYPHLPQKLHLPTTSGAKADAKSNAVMGTVVTTSMVVSGIFRRALSP